MKWVNWESRWDALPQYARNTILENVSCTGTHPVSYAQVHSHCVSAGCVPYLIQYIQAYSDKLKDTVAEQDGVRVLKNIVTVDPHHVDAMAVLDTARKVAKDRGAVFAGVFLRTTDDHSISMTSAGPRHLVMGAMLDVLLDLWADGRDSIVTESVGRIDESDVAAGEPEEVDDE